MRFCLRCSNKNFSKFDRICPNLFEIFQITKNRFAKAVCFEFNQSIPNCLIQPGFDGGQKQWFVMEIFDQQTGQLQANVSSKYPIFNIGGLDAGRLLKIIIFSANVKGNSDSVILEAFTLKTAEKQMGIHAQFELSPILTIGIFIGVLTALICIALGTIMALKLRTAEQRRRQHHHQQHDLQQGKSTRPGNLPIKEKISLPLGAGEMDEMYDDKNPDVVPYNEGECGLRGNDDWIWGGDCRRGRLRGEGEPSLFGLQFGAM